MIAHLGLYNRPETAAAHQRFWLLIRQSLGDGPPKLSRDSDLWRIWRKPALLLAQTCSLPYRSRLHGHVSLIGTPDYFQTAGPAGHCQALLLSHKDNPGETLADFHGKRLAYSDALSHAGWAAPMLMARAQAVGFSQVIKSGSHFHAAQQVASGQADITSIDAVTWQLMLRFDRVSDQLRVVAQTPASPGLPYISARANDPAPLFAAIRTAIKALAPADRELLMLRDLIQIPAQDYLAIATPPGPKDTLAPPA